MVGLIIEGSGSYRIALAALGVQSVLGAVIIAGWRRLPSPVPVAAPGRAAQMGKREMKAS